KYYEYTFRDVDFPRPLKWIWRTQCTPKIKVFAWLMGVDRLNTRNMLRRRNFNVQPNHNCVLCRRNTEETRCHLNACWGKLHIQWLPSLSFFDMIMVARSNFQGPKFTEVILIAAWALWRVRNAKIFDGINPTFSAWWHLFREDLTLHTNRFSQQDRHETMNWLSTL
ncbi:hypothetical protein EJB05_32749, partial [Eragrostis curvula]